MNNAQPRALVDPFGQLCRLQVGHVGQPVHIAHQPDGLSGVHAHELVRQGFYGLPAALRIKAGRGVVVGQANQGELAFMLKDEQLGPAGRKMLCQHHGHRVNRTCAVVAQRAYQPDGAALLRHHVVNIAGAAGLLELGAQAGVFGNGAPAHAKHQPRIIDKPGFAWRLNFVGGCLAGRWVGWIFLTRQAEGGAAITCR